MYRSSSFNLFVTSAYKFIRTQISLTKLFDSPYFQPDFNDKYGLLEYVSHKATKEPEFQGKFGEYHGTIMDVNIYVG